MDGSWTCSLQVVFFASSIASSASLLRKAQVVQASSRDLSQAPHSID